MRADLDATAAMADRVADEVEQDLTQPPAVGEDHLRMHRVVDQLDVAPVRRRPEHVKDLGDDLRDGAGSCGTAAALGTPVIAVDVRTDPRWAAYRVVAQAAGLRSCWSTPIRGRDGGIVGTFAVYHGDPHSPSAREELLVQRFTHLASVAIDHASLVGALIESEERFRRSFDANSLGMAILDAGRTITTANAALATLAGGLGEVLGRRLADLVTPTKGTLDDLLAPLAAAGVDPDSAPVVVFEGLLLATGMPRPQVEVEVTVSRLTTHDGTNTQDIVNVFDLTERRAAEQHLRARLEAETARRTAEQHSRAKSELLAALGHEVRTSTAMTGVPSAAAVPHEPAPSPIRIPSIAAT